MNYMNPYELPPTELPEQLDRRGRPNGGGRPVRKWLRALPDPAIDDAFRQLPGDYSGPQISGLRTDPEFATFEFKTAWAADGPRYYLYARKTVSDAEFVAEKVAQAADRRRVGFQAAADTARAAGVFGR